MAWIPPTASGPLCVDGVAGPHATPPIEGASAVEAGGPVPAAEAPDAVEAAAAVEAVQAPAPLDPAEAAYLGVVDAAFAAEIQRLADDDPWAAGRLVARR